jgi:hypothetical protein
LVIATLDVLKRMVHDLHCVFDYQIRDLLADRPKLNLMIRLQIHLCLFLPLADGGLVAEFAAPMSFRSMRGRSCQCRIPKAKGAPFSARLNFFSI